MRNRMYAQNVLGNFRKKPLSIRAIMRHSVWEKLTVLVEWLMPRLMPRLMYVSIGLLLSILWMTSIEPSQPSSDTSALVVHKYKAMIERDDQIIDWFMAGEWDRSKCIERIPEQRLADGSWLTTLKLVECENE